ncbi:hypothetical protein OCU04_011632 [Sclerotinia nivalis]|uniref:Single-strand DNA deaminase toxin A-like C-terminal domain-containing protein n=1 Tax=Sclerotinia nivalis TaxID=352851 RepID=A0A9X0ABX3_9HELO|nr:hypothetical protein OCU04_011632 [Sclerotinia nivalis]
MVRKNGPKMPQGPRKQKSRRGQRLRAAKTTRKTRKARNIGNEVLKAMKTIPVAQGPIMRWTDGTMQAAVEKGRLETTLTPDIEVKEISKDFSVVQEQAVIVDLESLDQKDPNDGQARESIPDFKEENDPEVVDLSTQVEFHTEFFNSVLHSVNEIKQMMERNEENQERRHQELCAIFMKRRDAETESLVCSSAEIQTSQNSSRYSEESRESESYNADTGVEDSVARTPGGFANIDAKTLDSVDRSLDPFADSIDVLIYTLEKTSLKPSHDMKDFGPPNPDQSRWFRYHQNTTGHYVELCQLVPQVVQSYPVPREKAAIARLNINGSHICTAVSGWNTPYPKDDIISNNFWTLQVEEICKIINHSLPDWSETLDYGFPGRYHACHAEKQLIAWYLYENTFANYQVNIESPYALPYREIKYSAPRGALIVVSRQICEDCKIFIEKVKTHFGIPDHFHVESRICPEDIFDTEKPNKLLQSCNEWRTS